MTVYHDNCTSLLPSISTTFSRINVLALQPTCCHLCQATPDPSWSQVEAAYVALSGTMFGSCSKCRLVSMPLVLSAWSSPLTRKKKRKLDKTWKLRTIDQVKSLCSWYFILRPTEPHTRTALVYFFLHVQQRYQHILQWQQQQQWNQTTIDKTRFGSKGCLGGPVGVKHYLLLLSTQGFLQVHLIRQH